jgi:hypothetical protein
VASSQQRQSQSNSNLPRDKKPKAAQTFALRAAARRQTPHPNACLLASITAVSAASFGIHRSAGRAANRLLVAAMNKLILMDSSRADGKLATSKKRAQSGTSGEHLFAFSRTVHFIIQFGSAIHWPLGVDLEMDLLSLSRGLAAPSVARVQ